MSQESIPGNQAEQESLPPDTKSEKGITEKEKALLERFDPMCSTNEEFSEKYLLLQSVLELGIRNLSGYKNKLAPLAISQEEVALSRFRESIAKNNGSFLLSYFAEDFLTMGTEEVRSFKGDRISVVPFEIAPKVFALDKDCLFVLVSKTHLEHDGLYISQPKDYEVLATLIKGFEESIQKEGNNSQDLFQKMSDQLIPFFKSIEYKTNVSTLDSEIYRELQEPYHRERLLEETGIVIAGLSIEEQLYFISYLKFCNEDSLERVKKFHSAFSISGFRTFLSLEHGAKEMGDTILALGETLPLDEAKKIFAEYSNLVSAASKLSAQLEPVFKNEEDVSFKSIPLQLQDALMLRAKDILVGAEKVVEQQGKEKLNTPDVLCAIEGIRTLVEMLADIHDRAEFQFERQNQTQSNLFKYDIKDKKGYEYMLKIFARARSETNAQARVNIELSFDTQNPNPILQKAFYNEVVSHTQNNTSTGSVLRIGLDREDHGGEGMLSLDIGRSERSDEQLTRSGDVLGNLLVLASEEGHHTTSPFNKELASEENFSLLVSKLTEYLSAQDRA